MLPVMCTIALIGVQMAAMYPAYGPLRHTFKVQTPRESQEA